MSENAATSTGEPLVSVITRTKNRPLLLSRAMQSLIGQTYSNWEHVVFNDGGNAEPLDVLFCDMDIQYKGRLLPVHSKASLGVGRAANRAIESSSGSLLILLDDDDSWEPQFLQKCVNELRAQQIFFPNVRGIITHSRLVLENMESGRAVTTGTRPFNAEIQGGILSLDKLLYFNMFPPSSFVFGRAEWEQVGKYREDLAVLEDWDFQLRYALQHEIWVIPEILVNYHQRPMATGVMSNTVVAGRATHATYLQMLKNEWLRRDLNEGKFGPGAYVNLRWHLETIEKNSWNSTYSLTFIFISFWRGFLLWATGPEKSILYRRFRKRVADRGWGEACKSVITWIRRSA